MYTYQDFLKVKEKSETERMNFAYKAIEQHKSTELYKQAVIADQYSRHRNTTINQYQKLLYTITGKAVPDNWSANFKMASKFFDRFITQENQYLLGNGVTWKNESTESKLGEDFDIQLQKIGKMALVGGVAFGFLTITILIVLA